MARRRRKYSLTGAPGRASLTSCCHAWATPSAWGTSGGSLTSVPVGDVTGPVHLGGGTGGVDQTNAYDER